MVFGLARAAPKDEKYIWLYSYQSFSNVNFTVSSSNPVRVFTMEESTMMTFVVGRSGIITRTVIVIVVTSRVAMSMVGIVVTSRRAVGVIVVVAAAASEKWHIERAWVCMQVLDRVQGFHL